MEEGLQISPKGIPKLPGPGSDLTSGMEGFGEDEWLLELGHWRPSGATW